MEYQPLQVEEWKAKAKMWDDLDAKISKFYFDENGEALEESEVSGDLCDIGEIAATALGYF